MEEKQHRIKNDELINETYQVIKKIGQGAFSKVYKVINLKNNKYYALKQIRNKPHYIKWGLNELKLLKDIKSENRINFCCKLKDDFKYNNHICFIFNLYDINLYQYLQSRNFRGMNLNIIKRISQQLLYALDFLKTKKIIHCDLKPENIVFEKNTNNIRIIDFGSSTYCNGKIYTYIQSRYYRSPEVVLGYDYSPAIDMWSFGCIIFELYTGSPLFKCKNSGELIVLITQILGLPNNKLLDKGCETQHYFLKYKSMIPFKKDNYSPRKYSCYDNVVRPPKSLTIENILTNDFNIFITNHNQLIDFIDIIKKCITWEPEERLNPNDGLKHNFLKNLCDFKLELKKIESLESKVKDKLLEN